MSPFSRRNMLAFGTVGQPQRSQPHSATQTRRRRVQSTPTPADCATPDRKIQGWPPSFPIRSVHHRQMLETFPNSGRPSTMHLDAFRGADGPAR
jgi:hypothetical protein